VNKIQVQVGLKQTRVGCMSLFS